MAIRAAILVLSCFVPTHSRRVSRHSQVPQSHGLSHLVLSQLAKSLLAEESAAFNMLSKSAVAPAHHMSLARLGTTQMSFATKADMWRRHQRPAVASMRHGAASMGPGQSFQDRQNTFSRSKEKMTTGAAPAPKAAPAPAPTRAAAAKAGGSTAPSKTPTSGPFRNLHPSVKFTYFALWAKGPAIALALEHSGIDWEGAFPEDWKTMKATTPWLELPVLEVPRHPDIGGTMLIGHEIAILNYIGKRARSKEMEGATMQDYLSSQQLMQEAEDIYRQLTLIKTGVKSEEEIGAFWAGEDPTTHNRNFGIKVFLNLLEKFYNFCDAGEGKYTQSGITVGECKLFATLHACKMQKPEVIDGYPGVLAFYERFSNLDRTQAIMSGTGKMPGEFQQYFK